MAASKRNCSGQSLIEFVLFLPMLLGMLFLLLRVNSAIQTSIVNQKYSRQRIFELTANHAHYPDMGRRSGGQGGAPRVDDRRANFINRGENRMVIGVAEESTLSVDTLEPSAPVRFITRSPPAVRSASDEAKNDGISRRAKVRIRNTVELCTPVLSTGRGGARLPIDTSIGEGTFAQVTFCTGGFDE